MGVRHIKLDVSHGDYGNTPRGIGAQLAISEGYCGVAFLDADNWYDSDHVQVCIEAAKSLTGNYIDCDYVIARRRLISPDFKSEVIISEGRSMDTNLYFFCPGSYFMVPYWNLMPKEVPAVRKTQVLARKAIHLRVDSENEKRGASTCERSKQRREWELSSATAQPIMKSSPHYPSNS
jgi:hypothetical protein